MMNPERDYLDRGWKVALSLILLLVCVGLVPPQSIGGVSLRRANILSDLITFDDAAAGEAAEPQLFDEEEFAVDLAAVDERIGADTIPHEIVTRFEWRLPHAAPAPEASEASEALAAQGATAAERLSDTVRLSGGALVPVEDFDTTGLSRMSALYRALVDGNRPVRIAFMGDSFVEGDILTADLRETLQERYGGCGVGFAPMASPLTGFRRTVKTSAKGWSTYNVMQYKSVPADLRDHFFVSGWVCRPENGASTRWESTSVRRGLDSCTTARILLLSEQTSRVEVTLNDTLQQSFTIEGAPALRQILVEAPAIRSLTLRVAEGAGGMVGYGTIFEGGGVTVDNYSVRSNNGQAMFRTDPSVNAQVDAFAPYDLVVLQYGLNIMQQGVRRYDGYSAQIEKMIAYVRRCFPSAAVLVLGVSERGVKGERGFEPMDALPYMTEAQRSAARNMGAAFWDTSAAMQAEGGMARFVSEGWAGKDYTHINYAGGRRVARALCDALGAETAALRRADLLQKLRQQQLEPVVAPQLHARIDRELLSCDSLQSVEK